MECAGRLPRRTGRAAAANIFGTPPPPPSSTSRRRRRAAADNDGALVGGVNCSALLLTRIDRGPPWKKAKHELLVKHQALRSNNREITQYRCMSMPAVTVYTAAPTRTTSGWESKRGSVSL